LPRTGLDDRQALVQAITAGHARAATSGAGASVVSQALAVTCLARGYQRMFSAAGLFMMVAAVATWFLVDARETPPVARSVPKQASR
jgi:hypothetical protein